MSLQQNFQLMGDYNQWMNHNLYECASSLSSSDFSKDRGAFFNSVSGTLNHILVADIIWLKRFLKHPAHFAALQPLHSVPTPSALNDILHTDVDQLRLARQEIDSTIIEFVHQATDSDYDYNLSYKNTKGLSFCKKFGFLVHHLFNHQTHHRGQLTVLLSQIGMDFGSTDLLAKIQDAV